MRRKPHRADEMIKVGNAVAAFWDTLESPNSRRGYESDWRQFTAWLERQREGILEVRAASIQRYLVELRDGGKSKPTRARALSVIRSVYDYLVVSDLLTANPARSVKNIRTHETLKTPWLDEDALIKLLTPPLLDSWRARRDRLCLVAFVGLGWRRSEIARIQIGDIADGAITVTLKGAKKIKTGIPGWLASEMVSWVAWAELFEGPLFPKAPRSRQSVSGSTVYRIVKAAAQRAGLPDNIAPHALRRSYITILGQRGVDLKTRQLAVGHSSQATTERYDRAAKVQAPGELLGDLIERAKKQ